MGIGHLFATQSSQKDLGKAVKPQALQLLPQGITGCRGVLHLQTGPWSFHHALPSTVSTGLVHKFVSFNRHTEPWECGEQAGTAEPPALR